MKLSCMNEVIKKRFIQEAKKEIRRINKEHFKPGKDWPLNLFFCSSLLTERTLQFDPSVVLADTLGKAGFQVYWDDEKADLLFRKKRGRRKTK